MIWVQVRFGMRCGFGCTIQKDDLALLVSKRFHLCQKHAGTQYRLHPPRGMKKREEETRREAANASDGKLRQMPTEDR